MRSSWIALGICCVLVAGCGRVKPTVFTQDNKPLAVEMEKALDKKDTVTIAKIVGMSENRLGTSKITGSEHVILKTCKEYAAADKWDDAKKLIADCLKAGK